MAKRITIKEIAELSGVSAGTVDRILHDRGGVSKRSKTAVEKVLSATGYASDDYYAAVANPRVLAVLAPTFTIGDYWSSVFDGVRNALKKINYPGVSLELFLYNQFDVYSCITAHKLVLEKKPDGVLIGPTFLEEARNFCASLDEMGIPYVFVDSHFDGTNPLGVYATDQLSAGKVMAHLLTATTFPGSKLAVFESKRSGSRLSTNSMARRDGFVQYLHESGREADLIETCYTSTVPSENEESIKRILEAHKDLGGIAVLNSRGSSIAEVLEDVACSKIKLVSFDLTLRNVEFLKKGSIFALLCQHPYWQGFEAASALVNYLIRGKTPANKFNLLSVDVVLKEIVDFYKENKENR